MLKTRIQLPVVEDGQPTEWMRSLAALTQQYAEQTLLPAVCDAYEELPSVAEKMHFEPVEYRHIWHARPHPGTSDLLTVSIETTLSHGGRELLKSSFCVAVRAGCLVRSTDRMGMRRPTRLRRHAFFAQNQNSNI
jgi:hypothetical protein